CKYTSLFAYHCSWDSNSGPPRGRVVATFTRQDLALRVISCRAQTVRPGPALSSSGFFTAYCSARVGSLLAAVGNRNVCILLGPRTGITPLNSDIRCAVRGNDGRSTSKVMARRASTAFHLLPAGPS